MNWLACILIGLGILSVLLLSTGWWRYVLTGYLIARVTPYEQPGGGAGSILVVGDSTGYGTGASRSEESVAGRLGQDYPGYAIKNDSVNGRKIAGAVDVISNLSESDTYDLILFQIGANDMIGGATATETLDRMKRLIDQAQAHAEQIVIITSGNIGAVPASSGAEAEALQNTSREYTTRMIELANEYQNVSFVPLFDELADDPFVAQPRVYTSIDGLHPTSAGYAVWYEKAKQYFDTALVEK